MPNRYRIAEDLRNYAYLLKEKNMNFNNYELRKGLIIEITRAIDQLKQDHERLNMLKQLLDLPEDN